MKTILKYLIAMLLGGMIGVWFAHQRKDFTARRHESGMRTMTWTSWRANVGFGLGAFLGWAAVFMQQRPGNRHNKDER